MFRKARHRITLLTIITLLSLGGALQPQHVAALAGQVMLADTNESWNTGRFFRTGLASAQIGGVQLVPVNVLKTWSTTTPLPRPLSSHTSTIYRDHLFVMGGNTLTDDTLVKTPSFFVTRLGNPVFGQLRPWTDYTATQPLPEPLSDMASVVVEVNNAMYLYVLGGQLAAGTTVNGVSSNTVYVNRLVPDATGQLIPRGWQLIPEDSALGLPLPHATNPGSTFERGGGALAMSAVTVALGGVPYIYIFGGNNRRFFAGSGYTSEGDGTQSAVYRTAVNADGTLAGWTKIGDIQEILEGREATTVGLTGAAGVTFTEPLDNRTGVYLIGGSRKSGRVSVDDAQVYVARFENDGTLEWLPTGSMSESRAGHDAVQANGRIQVAGGTQDRSQTPSLPKTSMALGLINDDLSLYLPTEGTTNFELIEGALINARMNHTFESISAGINGEWAYVIGGQRQISNGALERATDQVVLGNLNEPPTPGDSYVRDAKYYSQIFDFGAESSYSSLEWTTLLGAGQKISIQYRASDNREVLGALSSPLNSVNGVNEATIPKIKGRYFQFVATLEASTVNRQSTPILSSMSLGLDRAGFPNLRVASDSVYMTDDGAPSNPTHSTRILDAITIAPRVTVTNKAYVNPTTKLPHPVFDANFQGNGGFFVDIYVVPPGEDSGPPTMGEIGVAWAEVSKDQLGANASVQITPEQWNPASCVSKPCPAVNWQRIFPEDGTYTVYIMVDSTDNANAFPVGQVQETDSPTPNTLGERDNLYGPLTVAIGEEPPTPTATKPVSPTRTPSPSPTRTTTPDETATRTPGNAATATAQSRTATAQSGTATATQTPGNAATATAQSRTATAQSGTATGTPGNAATATAQSRTATAQSGTATQTPGNAATATAQSRTATAQSGTATVTRTPGNAATATAQSGTATAQSGTATVTRTPGNAATATAQSRTATAQSGTATRTAAPSPTRTTTQTPGNAATATSQSRTATAQTGTATATRTPGNAATATAQSRTATAQSGTATGTPGNAATATAQSGTATAQSGTATQTPGNAATATAQSGTATAQSGTATVTRTPGNAATATAQSGTATAQSGTATGTPGNAATATSQSRTATAQSGTATRTATPSPTRTSTQTPGNATTATAQSRTATAESGTATVTRTPGNAATATAQSRTATAQSGTATVTRTPGNAATATAQSRTATAQTGTATATRTPGNAATATSQSRTATAESGTATRTPTSTAAPDNRVFLPSIQR